MLKNYYLKIIFILTLGIFPNHIWAKNSIESARVWPAREYTRVTLESIKAISNDQMILKNPEAKPKITEYNIWNDEGDWTEWRGVLQSFLFEGCVVYGHR